MFCVMKCGFWLGKTRFMMKLYAFYEIYFSNFKLSVLIYKI